MTVVAWIPRAAPRMRFEAIGSRHRPSEIVSDFVTGKGSIMRLPLFIVCTFCAVMGQTIAVAKDNSLTLVTDSSQKSIVGELLSETDKEVVLKNIKDGTEFRASKQSLKRFEKSISDETAIRYTTLPAVVAWHVAQIGGKEHPIGKVANVAQNVTYLTLGADKGISVGQKLDVYRKGTEIIDPDTNKVLAVERPKVGVLEVTEVNKDFSKAKSVGDLEVALQKGDEVEPQRQKFQVAVLPFRTEKGEVYEAAAELAENLTTLLVRQEITVLERSALDKVVLELALQNVVLFEPENVQKLGQLAGASVIVTGKIVVKGKAATAYARLIDVRSGKILYAASNAITIANSKVVESSGDSKTSDAPTIESRTGNSKTGNSRTSDSKAAERSKSSKSAAKGAFQSKVIELTDEAPSAWILKEARVGLKLSPDRDYVWSALPKEIIGGSAIWRDTGYRGWLNPGVVTALKDCNAYALVRWKSLGKIEIDEIAFNQFAKDGWEEVDGDVKCTFPSGEDWRWKALRKEVKEGDVILQLDHVKFGNWGVQFIFK